MSRLRLGIPAAIAAVVLVASACSDQQTGPTEVDGPLAPAGETELKLFCDALFPDPGGKNKPQGERSACYSKVESLIKQCEDKQNPSGCQEQVVDLISFTRELFDELAPPPYDPALPLFPTGSSSFAGETTADAVSEFYEWINSSAQEGGAPGVSSGVIDPEATETQTVEGSNGTIFIDPGTFQETTLVTWTEVPGLFPTTVPSDQVIGNAAEITADPDFDGTQTGATVEICMFDPGLDPFDSEEPPPGTPGILQELDEDGVIVATFNNEGQRTCEPIFVESRVLRPASPGDVSGLFSKLRTPHWIVVNSIQRFDDRSSFLTALGDVTTETQDFSAFNVGDPVTSIIPGVLDASSTFDNLEVFGADKILFGFDNTTRSAGEGQYTFSFVASRNAIGFDVVGQNPATDPATATVQVSAGAEIFSLSNPTNDESTPYFVGWISTFPIAQVVVDEGPEIGGSGNEEIGFDDFVTANTGSP